MRQSRRFHPNGYKLTRCGHLRSRSSRGAAQHNQTNGSGTYMKWSANALQSNTKHWAADWNTINIGKLIFELIQLVYNVRMLGVPSLLRDNMRSRLISYWGDPSVPPSDWSFLNRTVEASLKRRGVAPARDEGFWSLLWCQSRPTHVGLCPFVTLVRNGLKDVECLPLAKNYSTQTTLENRRECAAWTWWPLVGSLPFGWWSLSAGQGELIRNLWDRGIRIA